jgi:hypothetical protein
MPFLAHIDGNVNTATTGTGTTAGILNNGVTIISGSTQESYVLGRPEIGITKRIICTSATTTIAPLIRGSTAAAQSVTFDAAGNTMFRFSSGTSHHRVVDLIGLTTLTWAITNIYPCLTTGLGHGTITLSTT